MQMKVFERSFGLLQVIGTYGSVGQKERYLRAAVEHRVRFRLLARELCSALEPLAPSSLFAEADSHAASAAASSSPTLLATVQPGAEAVNGPFVLSGQKLCVGSHADAEKSAAAGNGERETVLLVAARRRLGEYKDTVRTYESTHQSTFVTCSGLNAIAIARIKYYILYCNCT